MGRRREFDVDEVLDAALRVFWRKGFDGASYTDLTEAAGVERPALYSAFGNKEALFLKALARYQERYLGYVPEALALPTAREVAEHILLQAADLNTRFPAHPGCLGLNSALGGSDDAEPVRQALIDFRAAAQAAIRERFERARAEGDLPSTADPNALADFLLAVAHGMSVQAKAGSDRSALEAVARQALAAWPAGPPKRRVRGTSKAG